MKTTEFIKESIDQPEYNDEVGMVKNNLHTLVRTSVELAKSLQGNENLPEWCQEKIAVAKSMIVAVGDYMISQHEMGQQPEIDSFDMDRAFAEAMDEAQFGTPGNPELSVKGTKSITPIQGDKVEIKFGYNDYYDTHVTRGEVLQIRPDGMAVVGIDKTGKTEKFPLKSLKVIGPRGYVAGSKDPTYGTPANPELSVKGVAEATGNEVSVPIALKMLKKARAYLDQFDPEDDDDYFDAYETIAAEFDMESNDSSIDPLTDLLDMYEVNPQQAAQALANHLQSKGVAEAGMSDQHKENHLKAVRAYQAKKKAEKEQRSADSKSAFGSMFGGSPADLTKNLKIRESGKLKEDATGGGTGSSSVAVTMQTLGEKGAFSKKEINKKLGGYTNQLTSGGPVKIGKAK